MVLSCAHSYWLRWTIFSNRDLNILLLTAIDLINVKEMIRESYVIANIFMNDVDLFCEWNVVVCIPRLYFWCNRLLLINPKIKILIKHCHPHYDNPSLNKTNTATLNLEYYFVYILVENILGRNICNYFEETFKTCFPTTKGFLYINVLFFLLLRNSNIRVELDKNALSQ